MSEPATAIAPSHRPVHLRAVGLLVLVPICLACAGCGGEGGTPILPEQRIDYFDGAGVRNMAHRGGSGIAPENTLLAFEAGLAAGATILETDVHTTSDGRIVILHDDTVDRTTDGYGPVNGMTLAHVKELDAAYWFTTDGGLTYPYRGKGIRIPTLEEAFERFPRERFNIEIKQRDPPMEKALVELVHAMGMTRQVLIASMDDIVLERVRRLDPSIPTNAGPLEILRFVRTYPNIPPQGPIEARAFQIPDWVAFLLPRIVPQAHEYGIEVHLWTVNKREDMERAIALGVDGIITDYPNILAELLRSREGLGAEEGLVQ